MLSIRQFQYLKWDHLLLFFVVYHCELSILGFRLLLGQKI